MKKIASLFDEILKIIAASYLLLTIAGFIDLKTYYSKFDVPINEYITASEILFSSLDKIILVFIALLVQLSLWLYVFGYLFDYNLEESLSDGERRPKEHHDETIHRLVRNKTVMRFWIFIITGTIISLILAVIFPKNNVLTTFRDFLFINYWMAMWLYMGLLQATRSLWLTFKTKQENNGKILITIAVFLVVLIASIWVKNAFLFNRVRKHGNNNYVEIILGDSLKITQTDTIRYLGRTENYFFFWDKVKNQTQVYPAGEVKQIILKN